MRIALATVGTEGDVRPFAALAAALVSRGHEVTALTWPVHRAAMARPGVRVELAGPHADPARITAVAREAAERGPMAQVAVLRDFHLADGEAHYRRLRELLPDHDLVLLHTIHALAHAAVLDLGLPWASAAFDPVLLPTATAPPPGMPSLGPGNRLLWAVLDRMLASTGRPLDALLASAGSPQRGLPLFRARSDALHLVACSPSLIAVPGDLPSTTHVTGAWVDPAPPAALPAAIERFLADGAPPIVVTAGSMAPLPPSVLSETLGALLDAGRRVIAQGEPPGDVASPNLLVIGRVDHRALFRRTAVVVHHAGAGTTHAACGAGTPSVTVPQVGDQRYWADRLHRLGVAPPPLLLRGLTATALAERILSAAADREMRERAQALGDRLRSEDGLGTSVSLLEAVVRR